MTTVSRPATIGIVDSDPSAYDGLLNAGDGSELKVCFRSTGNDALRMARQWSVGLWIINTRLTDMSGFDLAEMLRRGRPGVRVFMVSDAYSVEEELQTLTLGLVKYLCKPVDPSWILQWGRPSVAAAKSYQFSGPAAAYPEPSHDAATIGAHSAGKLGPAQKAPEIVPVIFPFGQKPQRRPAA